MKGVLKQIHDRGFGVAKLSPKRYLMVKAILTEYYLSVNKK